MTDKILQKLRAEIPFFVFFIAITIVIAFFYGHTQIAMWIGFSLAALSAIGNDSIQSLGTFLSSNKKTPWWILWIFIGGIFILTVTYGWFSNGGGGVDFHRLEKIPRPENFTFLQVFAPAVLVLLTRFKIPVSTTFLILSVFATSKTIEAMLAKTFIGYVVALVVSISVWWCTAKYCNGFFTKPLSKLAEKKWRIGQWLTTAFLWITWLMQDTANIAVFLPRSLSFSQFIPFVLVTFLIIGFIFFFRGGKIQEIVTEKRDLMEVRAATLIDLVFAFILLFFKEISTLPMSTTWVFLGLLAGREIILCHLLDKESQYRKTFCLVGKDIILASVGLLISVGLAMIGRM
ncbi:hypothetical protein K9M41_04710 [Candidatus Gracilibacteria bacterium]|nr:hypothetical protein [Candidatus Gracilibacteria bacterium]